MTFRERDDVAIVEFERCHCNTLISRVRSSTRLPVPPTRTVVDAHERSTVPRRHALLVQNPKICGG